VPSDRRPESGETRPAQAAIGEFSRRRARQRSLKGGVLLILLSLVLWMLKFRGGPWSVGVVVAIVAVAAATGVGYWITWRCPDCGKSPGDAGRVLNYCAACGVPLVEGASRRVEQTPERAEWVVATLRPRLWWVRGGFVVALGGGGLVGWLLGRAGMRPWGLGIFLLGLLGWTVLLGRIWYCPECKGSLGPLRADHFCTRCGVPHSRKGLERARART